MYDTEKLMYSSIEIGMQMYLHFCQIIDTTVQFLKLF